MSLPSYHLRLFGCPNIGTEEVGAANVALWRHPLALAAILAAEANGTVTRDKLAALLWPEADTERARNRLRVALHALRQALGQEAIVSVADGLRLDTTCVRCDVVDFCSALDAGQPELAVQAYGGPFLDGFHLPDSLEFDQWAEAQRDRLARLYRGALEQLAEASAAAGELGAAVEWWRKRAAEEPGNGRVVVHLMEALERAGDAAGALREAERHARVLREEFDTDPSPEVHALAKRIRRAPNVAAIPGPVRATIEPTSAEAAAAIDRTPDMAPSPRPVERARRRTLTRLRWSVAIALVFVVLAAGHLLRQSSAGGVREPAFTSRIAVFPFCVSRQGDEQWRDDVALLLARAIDGAGGLWAVDPNLVLTTAAREEVGCRDQVRARALAARFNASRFVTGSVIASGGRLVGDVAVYHADGATLARVRSGTGTEDGYIALVDSLARGIMASTGQQVAGRLAPLAASTTRSADALLAYLDGERTWRAGDFATAPDRFERAVKLDTTFALAWFWLSRSAATLGQQPQLTRDAAEEAWRHAGRLPGRERRFIEAWVAQARGDAATAMDLYGRYLGDYPHDPFALYERGVLELHWGPLFGRTGRAARPYLERAFELDPGFGGSILAQLAYAARVDGDDRAVDSLLSRMADRPPGMARVAIEDSSRGGLPAFELALRRGDTAAQRRVTERLRGAGDHTVYRGPWWAVWAGDLESAVAVGTIATEPSRSTALRVRGHVILAALHLARGNRRAARQELSKLRELDSREALAYRALFSLLPLFPLHDDTIRSLRRELEAWHDFAPAYEPSTQVLSPNEGRHAHIRRYLAGLLSAQVGDTAAAAVQAQILDTLSQTGGSLVVSSNLALGVRARIAWSRGDPLETERLLVAIAPREPHLSAFGNMASERYLRAEALRASGRLDEALQWYEAMTPLNSYDALPFMAPSHLRRGEIFEGRGESARAIEEYTRFIRLWQGADADLQPLVDEIRARVSQLGGEARGSSEP